VKNGRFGQALVKEQCTKPMLVRMKPGEQQVLSERAREVGISLSRYLIECGLFECGLRQRILTPQDSYYLEFLAFQVALVRGDLKQISRKLNASSRTTDHSSLQVTMAKLDDVASLLQLFIGEV
jgi:hypothetical protein